MRYSNRMYSNTRGAAASRVLLLTAAVSMVGLLGDAPVLDAQERPSTLAFRDASTSVRELSVGEKVEPLVSLSWLELSPDRANWLALSSQQLTLQLANEWERELRLRLVAYFRVDGQLLQRRLGTYSLGPQQRGRIKVPLDAPGLSGSGRDSATQLVVRAEVFDRDGQAHGSATSPDLYLGGVGAEGLVYTEPLLRELAERQLGLRGAVGDPGVIAVGRGRKATLAELIGDPTDRPGVEQDVTAQSHATAATSYEICLRIPVTLDDQTGQANEVGTDGNWKGRGMRIAWVRDPNGNMVGGFPKYASAETGCFILPATQLGDYDVGIQPVGQLAAGNRLEVFDSTGQPFTYVGTLDIDGSGAYVWPYERILPRMYAIVAYAIQEGFRGNFNNETLTVWYGESPISSGCNKASTENTNHSHIAICTDSTRRKFLLGHEYGHANLARSSDGYVNDCGYGDSGHGMRGIEYNSCAAMEGWAHFVAADIWNDGEHSGGDPTGWFVYWGAGNALINVEAGQDGCAAVSGDPNGFRRRYADVCFSAGFAFDANCASGDCDGYGAELDWMRTWWDFHTDGDLAGSRPDHADLQTIISDASWSRETAWEGMVNALSGAWQTRWLDAGAWNGTSEP